MFEFLLSSLKIQEHRPETLISNHSWSDGMDMATPVMRFVSLQGSISESSNVVYEVTFPARVLKSYSVRKAFLFYFVSQSGGLGSRR